MTQPIDGWSGSLLCVVLFCHVIRLVPLCWTLVKVNSEVFCSPTYQHKCYLKAKNSWCQQKVYFPKLPPRFLHRHRNVLLIKVWRLILLGIFSPHLLLNSLARSGIFVCLGHHLKDKIYMVVFLVLDKARRKEPTLQPAATIMTSAKAEDAPTKGTRVWEKVSAWCLKWVWFYWVLGSSTSLTCILRSLSDQRFWES